MGRIGIVMRPARSTTKLRTPANNGRLRKTSITYAAPRAGTVRDVSARSPRSLRRRRARSAERPSVRVPGGQESVGREAVQPPSVRVNVPGVEKIEDRHLLRHDAPDPCVEPFAIRLVRRGQCGPLQAVDAAVAPAHVIR